MRDNPSSPALPGKDTSIWFVRLLGATFVGLGCLFVLMPGIGSALFGLPIPAPEWVYFLYPVAIGLRDLAFGLYLLILSFTASRRTMALILAATVLIPMGDFSIILMARGLSSPKHLLLHGMSAFVMLAGSIWLSRASKHDKTGGRS